MWAAFDDRQLREQAANLVPPERRRVVYPAPLGERSWLIGSSPACDVVVPLRTVSRRHCRLSITGAGSFLEDLGSRNGTYLNGRRVTGRVALSASDSVWLGRSAPMPWPHDHPACPPRLLRIGAAPDNDLVLNDPSISAHHALLRVVGDLISVEDLGTQEGTAVNERQNRVRQARLSPDDILYLGRVALHVAQLIDRSIR